jgi:hypothetical protein
MRLATHPGTGEAEAKLAMRMATKLMQSQNLTQADLIASETEEERSTRAGHSTVAITSTQGKMVRKQRWYGKAAYASCEAFDVQVYSESRRESLHQVFYGLADVRLYVCRLLVHSEYEHSFYISIQNTVAAALAFEMLHNQVETWALERKSELKGHTARNSYCIGVVERVLRDAQKENRQALKKAEEDEKKRIKEEAAARAAEISRLAMPVLAEPEPEVGEEKSKVRIEDIPEEDVRKPFLLDGPGSSVLFHSSNPLYSSVHVSSDDSGDDNGLLPSSIYDERAIDDDDDDDEVGIRTEFDHRDEGANDSDLDLDALEQKVKIKSEQVDPSPLTAPNCRNSPELRVKIEPAVKPEPQDELAALNDLAAAPSWTSALQLRTFRDNAKAIGDNYLKDAGKKLRKGRTSKPLKRDTAAYHKGWDDGQKVDLKRRKIED